MRSSRRWFLRGALRAGAGVVLGSGVYAWRLEPHWVEFVERALPIAGLPDALVGRRLVQLTDIHVGERVDDDYVLGVFERVRALAPDIVAFTGDFTDYHPDIAVHARRIYADAPRGSLATVGIFGNHDYGPGWRSPELAAALLPALEAGGIQVLRNTVLNVGGLDLVGLDDLWARQFNPEAAFAYRDPHRPAIVLSHNPDTVDEPGWLGYQGWVLSGHTHGGQCKPPFLPPPLVPVRNKRYTSGKIDVDGRRQLYIARGVGHTKRIRFNARPEVAVFTLRRS